jgi:hypothetical protein
MGGKWMRIGKYDSFDGVSGEHCGRDEGGMERERGKVRDVMRGEDECIFFF